MTLRIVVSADALRAMGQQVILWSRNRQVLLVKELTIGSRKIVDEGWGQR